MINRGCAYLGWLSQYPQEKEVTLTPLTGLEILNSGQLSDDTMVFEMGLNVNLQSLTIEQILARRQKWCLELAGSLSNELQKEGTLTSVKEFFVKHTDVMRQRPSMWFVDDATFRFSINLSFDLRVVLYEVSQAISAFRLANEFASGSNITALLTQLTPANEIENLISFGGSGNSASQLDNMFVTRAELIAVTNATGEAKMRLVNRAQGAGRGSFSWAKQTPDNIKRLTEVVNRLQPEGGESNDNPASRAGMDVRHLRSDHAGTLLSLLDLSLGDCLPELCQLEEKHIMSIVAICEVARDKKLEVIPSAEVASLPADSAVASILASLLARTKVSNIGAVPIAALHRSAEHNLNLSDQVLTPCEAGLVAFYFSQTDNRLSNLVLTPKLTFNNTLCSQSFMDLSDRHIGPAVAVEIAALVTSRCAEKVLGLSLARNNISGTKHVDEDCNSVFDTDLTGVTRIARQILTKSKIEVFDLTHCSLGSLALEALNSGTNWFSTRIRVLNLFNNAFTSDTEDMLTSIMSIAKRLRTLCGIEEDVSDLNLANRQLGPSGP